MSPGPSCIEASEARRQGWHQVGVRVGLDGLPIRRAEEEQHHSQYGQGAADLEKAVAGGRVVLRLPA